MITSLWSYNATQEWQRCMHACIKIRSRSIAVCPPASAATFSSPLFTFDGRAMHHAHCTVPWHPGLQRFCNGGGLPVHLWHATKVMEKPFIDYCMDRSFNLFLARTPPQCLLTNLFHHGEVFFCLICRPGQLLSELLLVARCSHLFRIQHSFFFVRARLIV
jgi:hypothetical protein